MQQLKISKTRGARLFLEVCEMRRMKLPRSKANKKLEFIAEEGEENNEEGKDEEENNDEDEEGITIYIKSEII
ncbi:unnamed protein product [Cuscuta europaea]|uniref:Uncharacterized protein n=1 Tax=Cuscuta europaea TaxID=41803 RepID=A0A9P0VS77_CUSEU|nr:unnamed protein product [Cuscuta europaea]